MVCLLTDQPEVQAQLDKYTNILGSEDAAYYVLSENNGYELDKAPNGQPSKLFSDLLSHYNGDETQAIRAKAKLFTESFRNWFGDWLSDDKTNVSKVVDENGEPLIVYHTASGKYKADFNKFDTFIEGQESAIYATNNYKMSETYRALEVEMLLPAKFNYLSPEDLPFYYDVIKSEFPNINFNAASYHELPANVRSNEYVKLYYELLDVYDTIENYEYNEQKSHGKDILYDFINKGDSFEEIILNTYYTKLLFINIRKPKIIEGNYSMWNKLSDNDEYGRTNSTRTLEKKYRNTEYDGIIFRLIKDNGPSVQLNLEVGDVYAAYNSNQVKSIFNSGNYSPTNEDIYNISLGIEGVESMTTDLPFDRIERVSSYIDNTLQIYSTPYRSKDGKTLDQLISDLNNKLFGLRNVITETDIKDFNNYLDNIQFFIYNELQYRLQQGISYAESRLKKQRVTSYRINNLLNSFLYDQHSIDDYSKEDLELLGKLLPAKVLNSQDKRLFSYYKHMFKENGNNKLNNTIAQLIKQDSDSRLGALAKKNKLQTVLDTLAVIPDARDRIYRKYISEYLRYYSYKTEQDKISNPSFSSFAKQFNSSFNLESYYKSNPEENLIFTIQQINDGTDAKSALQQIIKNSRNKELVRLAKTLLPYVSDSTKIYFEASNPKSNTIGGIYSGKTGNITIYTFSELFQQHPEHTVIHEIVHSITVDYIHRSPHIKQQLQQIADIIDNYSFMSNIYATQDAYELIAEFLSNPSFREFTKNIELTNRERSIFQELIDLLFGWLLNKDKQTVFDYLDKASYQIIENQYDLLNQLDTAYDQSIQYDKDFYLKQEDVEQQSKEINKTYEQIQRGLKNRLNSVKHYTTKNPKLWNQLSTLINHLQNSEAEQGIIQFIEHLTETIQDSQKFLDDPNREITLKQITQLSKDYVGFYKPLIDEILYLLDTTDIFKDLDNYQQLADTIRSLQANFTNLNNRFINIKKSRGKRLLVQYLQEHGMPQDKIDGILRWLDNPDHDDAVYMTWFGMASNDNNAILQTIAKMLNDVSNSVSRSTMDVGIQLTKLVQEAKKKYGNDVQKLLYERLDDGKFSGNIVKPINYGQYQKDKREYLDKLAKELGIKKDSKGMYQLPNDEETLSKWYDGLNKFYSKRVNRRFKPEYYDLRNRMLSLKTRNAIDEIQDYIDSIEQTMTVDGVQYENLLTESEYNQLLQLRKQKQLLAIPYNIDGTPKTGDDLLIAQELIAFNKAVEGKVKYIQSDKKYIQERSKVVKKYGEGSKELKLWEDRNTVLGYSQDTWDLIDSQAFFERQSDTYKELVEKRRQLRKMYADPKTGEINPDTLSDKEKQMLVQLDQDIANSIQLEQPAEMPQYSIKRDLNEWYYRDFNKAKEAGEQAFNEWYQANHYEDLRGMMQPASYYTTLSIIDNYNEARIDKQRIPSNKFSEISPMSEYYNKDFDQNGPSIQPKKEFYDNSKTYKAVIDKPEVKALYDAIEKYMREANSYIAFVNNVNDTRMPQIPARYMQVISRQNGILGALKYTFDELVTTQPDDMEFVEEHEYMPNGDPIRLIPTRFIKRLDDPNTISTDAVASVVAYYNMAVNFREMSNQQDKVELMLSLLKDITIRNKKGVIQPGASRLYQRAQLLIDRLMYGRETTPITKEILGKEVNVSKLLNRVRSFITKVNLSGNLWSIATSFFTDATYTTMEAKLGRFFTTEDLAFAVREYGRMLPDITANIGNPVPTNKLGFLMLFNQVVKDNRETFDRLDQSQVLRSLNQNFWYLGYTQSDYAVKSHILMSIYHNYRFVKGEGFMSKSQFIDKFYANDRKKGDIAFRQLQVTLYDAYEKKKDGSFGVKDEYSKYVTNKLQDDVKNRIDVLSRRIDGTLRDVDKAAVHANSWAAYLVMHKNFMIQGLHDRFKKEQYNLDLGVVEKGYYRVVGGMLSNMFKNNGFSIKQLIADYNQMSDYEQYAVRRVLYDLILITASTTLAIVIASLVDGDDDYDNWVTQSAAYLAMRSAFEFRTMYNPMEFFSMIKSPSAAFTTLDNASAFIDLVNPFAYTGDRGPFTIIDRGVYEGMPRILRNIIKVTPIRSIIEAQDPKSKRSYLENQLMSF